MIAKTNQESAFAILAQRRHELPDVLKAAFEHLWVASYQVGFGPPLVRSSDRIIHRVKESRTALEKLRAYFEVCVLDEEERLRLTVLHRKQLVRQHGPIEAEVLDAASSHAIDLTLRVHIPGNAPQRVVDSMKQSAVDFDLVPRDTPPEIMSARFLVRLSDPYNTRLLHREDVRTLVSEGDEAVAVELRVPVALRKLYNCWLTDFSQKTSYGFIDLEDPVSHARIHQDGKRS